MKKNNQIVRLVVMAIVMINSLFVMNGHNLIPFTDEEISMGISSAALVVSEIVNHYKNNDYSEEAKEGTEYMNELKSKIK